VQHSVRYWSYDTAFIRRFVCTFVRFVLLHHRLTFSFHSFFEMGNDEVGGSWWKICGPTRKKQICACA
jgi:hypothetical protein